MALKGWPATRGRARSTVGSPRPPERTPAACSESRLRASRVFETPLETELELPGRPEKPFGRSPERALRAKLDGVVVFSGGAVVAEHTTCEAPLPIQEGAFWLGEVHYYGNEVEISRERSVGFLRC